MKARNSSGEETSFPTSPISPPIETVSSFGSCSRMKRVKWAAFSGFARWCSASPGLATTHRHVEVVDRRGKEARLGRHPPDLAARRVAVLLAGAEDRLTDERVDGREADGGLPLAVLRHEKPPSEDVKPGRFYSGQVRGPKIGEPCPPRP